MAEVHFFTSKKPPEEMRWCPKMNRDIPVSQYPGDVACKYEACGMYAFDTQAEADAYRKAHCPIEEPGEPGEPTVGCTTDAECPEGYECQNGICVKKAGIALANITNITKIGLGAAGILIVFLLISKFMEGEK